MTRRDRLRTARAALRPIDAAHLHAEACGEALLLSRRVLRAAALALAHPAAARQRTFGALRFEGAPLRSRPRRDVERG